jgi:hypothetical protein
MAGRLRSFEKGNGALYTRLVTVPPDERAMIYLAVPINFTRLLSKKDGAYAQQLQTKSDSPEERLGLSIPSGIYETRL